MVRIKSLHLRVALMAAAMSVVLALAACSSKPAAPTAPPAPAATTAPSAPDSQPTSAPTQPQPTTAPTIAATTIVTPTATPGKGVVPKPTSAGKLDFTIEFGPSAPRQGDNKVQVTIILHITGGAPPFQVQEDGMQQKVTKRVDGVEYVRDWHNCGLDEPHTFTVISADGQKASLKTMIPYGTYKCP
jgi:hypothetical protein